MLPERKDGILGKRVSRQKVCTNPVWKLNSVKCHLTGESVHAGGVVDGEHSHTRLLFEQIDRASGKGPQLLSDLLLVEVVDVGAHTATAVSVQQPWRNIQAVYYNQVTDWYHQGSCTLNGQIENIFKHFQQADTCT